MVTARKPDALIILGTYYGRKHFACRLRVDLIDTMKEECKRLGCSQGVFLEIGLRKVIAAALVTPEEVFRYVPEERSAHKAAAEAGSLEAVAKGHRKILRRVLQRGPL